MSYHHFSLFGEFNNRWKAHFCYKSKSVLKITEDFHVYQMNMKILSRRLVNYTQKKKTYNTKSIYNIMYSAFWQNIRNVTV